MPQITVQQIQIPFQIQIHIQNQIISAAVEPNADRAWGMSNALGHAASYQLHVDGVTSIWRQVAATSKRCEALCPQVSYRYQETIHRSIINHDYL